MTEDGAWEAFVSKAKLPRLPLLDAPALPSNPFMTGSPGQAHTLQTVPGDGVEGIPQ